MSTHNLDYSKAICILSGGMDSATLLNYMKSKYLEVRAISFNYGQRHRKELSFAKKTCKRTQVHHEIFDIRKVSACLKGGSLTTKIKVPYGHYEDVTMKQTVVPNRNSILMNLAIGYAISNGFGVIGYGAHQGDHAIYPDCRVEFLTALRQLAETVHYEKILIDAPFIELSKRQVLEYGITFGVEYQNTWSCYEGRRRPCLRCGTCQERTISFRDCKIADPLLTRSEWKQALNIVKGVK